MKAYTENPENNTVCPQFLLSPVSLQIISHLSRCCGKSKLCWPGTADIFEGAVRVASIQFPNLFSPL